MRTIKIFKLLAGVVASALLAAAAPLKSTHADERGGVFPGRIRHVLLLSVDGLHAVDLQNCIFGVSGQAPYCPNLAALAQHGVNYTQASSSKPSDSFPGLMALLTGGTPRSTGVYYDNSFDRNLAPPANPTNDVAAGPCTPGVRGPGTEVLFDESIDIDLTQLNGGGGINTANLPRDPLRNCAPVFPHQYLRVNNLFEVVRHAGGYTAWSDKNDGYDIVRGPSGQGVDDLFIPEIKSNIVPLPGVPGCATVPDTSVTSDWTTSFADIKCYDRLKVQAILNEIDGKTHDGSSSAPVPTVFGMNFQAVSVGQKLVQTISGIKTPGGYLDAQGTPTPSLKGEIQFVDQAIGDMINELDKRGLLRSTVVIVTAKHGQSPIDLLSLQKIGDTITPVLTTAGIQVSQATEDDVALLWLKDQSQALAAAQAIGKSSLTAAGEVFIGGSLQLLFDDPLNDSRTPDVIVNPDPGVIYTTSGKKNAEHGGFSRADTNVALLVYNPDIRAAALNSAVETRQVAPTILTVLGLDPERLEAVGIEDTQLLPGLFDSLDR